MLILKPRVLRDLGARMESLEPRALVSATPFQIASALDLPQGVTPVYSGDTAAASSFVLNKTAGS